MKILIKAEAAATIIEIANFVEAKNTKGSGKRFAVKFMKSISAQLKTFNKHLLCKYPEFAKLKWKCFAYKNWIIAYQTEAEFIEIKVIIHGSLLSY